MDSFLYQASIYLAAAVIAVPIAARLGLGSVLGYLAAGIVIPPATARLVTDRFARMLWLSTALGAVSGAVGMVASYHLDIASGPVIVLTQSTLFAGAYAARLVGHRVDHRRSAAARPLEPIS